MYAKATTTISIMRGYDEEDEFGDQAPSDTPIYRGVNASLIDRSSVVYSPGTMEPAIVTVTTGRVGSGTDIKYGDRIKDEKTGTFYQIMNVSGNANPFMTPDMILNLKRISNYPS